MVKLIAVVEDDSDQRANYLDAILNKGYDAISFHDRQSALQGFQQTLPDLAILDIILGDEMDAGFELCRELLSRFPNLPVIFLTERIDEIDKISGLRLGAWDYLPKPISLDYLTERIASLLRIDHARASTNQTQRTQPKIIGALQLDTVAHLVSWKEHRINLSQSEFKMLEALVSNPGHSISYEQLMETNQSNVTTNTINTHVRNMRKKFERVDRNFDSIKSEYGFGYRWAR
ncbi:MAG: response regulator transcription factor [Gammaproteobacteria bacterium]|nr:response regulator transcription factor [Gammaproteobacteria bacterium]